MIGVGRTKNIVWSFTTSRCDTSDLWQEKLNEDMTQYFVDGEWQKLEFIDEYIKVKGEDEPELFKIKFTHRGPVIPFD